MLLRFKKETLREHPKNKSLLQATKALITARQCALRLLRATNRTEFTRLSQELNIGGFRHPHPFEFRGNDLVEKRKRDSLAECAKMKLNKKANLKVSLGPSEGAFIKNKEQQLAKIINSLAFLYNPDGSDNPLDIKFAEGQLEKLFTEVVEERRNEVLCDPVADSLIWYTNESKHRTRYAALQVEKAQRQLRRKR